MQYVISAANAKDYTTGMGNTFNLTLVLYALNTSVRYIYVSRHPILFFFLYTSRRARAKSSSAHFHGDDLLTTGCARDWRCSSRMLNSVCCLLFTSQDDSIFVRKEMRLLVEAGIQLDAPLLLAGRAGLCRGLWWLCGCLIKTSRWAACKVGGTDATQALTALRFTVWFHSSSLSLSLSVALCDRAWLLTCPHFVSLRVPFRVERLCIRN